MHEMPINSKCFEEYIKKNGLFEKAREYLKEYLEDWWKDDPDAFFEDMEAPFEKVMKKYKFRPKTVEIDKNFLYEPPEDYLSISIWIEDEKGNYIGVYIVFLDFSFELFDDMLIAEEGLL